MKKRADTSDQAVYRTARLELGKGKANENAGALSGVGLGN